MFLLIRACVGLVDTHIHGPQYINGGKGTNLPLLEWLETYTFPSETRLKNVDIAANVYDKVVERTLRNGTTTAMYFATIHLEASKKFVEILESQGQRAFVGKGEASLSFFPSVIHSDLEV